jgi:membrane protease YdiL (CAAX protease family)
MGPLSDFWNRVPVVLRAVFSGILILVCGSLPWSILISLNTKMLPSIPWSILPMGIYLWLFWKYLCGRVLTKPKPELRRTYLRVKPLSGKVWTWSMLSGALAFVSLGALKKIVERLVTLPAFQSADYSQYPLLTVLSAIIMGAFVSGIVEESAFRGYMQVPLENRYGLLMAIIVVGLVFGLTHFTHPWMTLALLPMYLVVAAVYGVLANTTGSILPGVVLHVIGNAYQDIVSLLRGSSHTPLPSIQETGIDLTFTLNCCLTLLCGVTAVLSYRRLHSSCVSESHSTLEQPA